MEKIDGLPLEVNYGPRELVDEHDSVAHTYNAIEEAINAEHAPLYLEVLLLNGQWSKHYTRTSMRDKLNQWNKSFGFFSNGIKEVRLVYCTYTRTFTPLEYHQDHLQGVMAKSWGSSSC